MGTANPKRSSSSALKRLKSSLKDIRLVGPKQRSQKVNSRDGNIDKSKFSLVKNQINPFESKFNKVKHNVLGKRIKGTQGKPGLRRQIGIDKRKKTLLVEMENKNKVGGIVDHRFGENNSRISPEEKMLERFTKERQKRSKSSLFNLEEDDLTHYGQSLAEIDDFGELDSASSDEDGAIDMNTVARSHFGGFEDTNDNGVQLKKSKNEIMKELITKSKMHKYERQLEKDEDEIIRQELDMKLDSIRNLLIMSPKLCESLESQETAFQKQSKVENKCESKQDEKYEEYDRIVRELAFEKRARPTDRTKSEEEIALEEKEKLEKLEHARKKRMEGLSSDSDDDKSKRKRRKRHVSLANDLDDYDLTDKDDDYNFGLGKGISFDIGRVQEDDDDDDNDDDDDDDDEDDEDDDKDDVQSEDEDEQCDEDYDRDHIDLHLKDSKEDINDFSSKTSHFKNYVDFRVTKKNNRNNEENESTLAYIFPCPSTMEEFLNILENIGDKDIPVVVHRILTLHNVKLSLNNQEKLKKFFNILMGYIYTRLQELPCPMHLINQLSLQIFDLIQQIPEYSIQYFIGRIDHLKTNIIKNYKFPGITDLFLFKLLGKIFTTSDFHHSIVTPTLLLIGQYLSQCQVINGKDLVAGLFLCNLVYEYQALSRRIVPEAINFLFMTLIYLAPKNTYDISSIPFPDIPCALQIKDGKKIETKLLNFPEILNGKVGNLDAGDSDNFRVSVLLATLHIIELYAKLYNSTSAFIELFNYGSELLSNYPLDKFSDSIKDKIKTTQEVLQRLRKLSLQNRKSLELQHHKPIPIPTYVPKFQENFSIDKHYDPDKERAKINKLKSQYKKERKGAIRELRKDSQFIARQHIYKIKEKDFTYKRKINSIMDILENEQSEKKAYEKLKRK